MTGEKPRKEQHVPSVRLENLFNINFFGIFSIKYIIRFLSGLFQNSFNNLVNKCIVPHPTKPQVYTFNFLGDASIKFLVFRPPTGCSCSLVFSFFKSCEDCWEYNLLLM